MAERKIAVVKKDTSAWTYEIAAGDTKAKAAIEYEDDFAGWQQRAPDLGDAHPDLQGFELVRMAASRREGKIVTVRLEFESFAFSADYPGRPKQEESIKRYDFEIPTGEEHILTNERYAEIDTAERIALLNLSNGQETDADGASYADAVTSELGLNALEKIRKGQTHYLVPSFIWIERFTTSDLTQIQIAKIGEIMDPPGPRPNPGENRNYLYLGATGRGQEDGENWDVERRWQLSAPGKWDDLYDPSFGA